MVGVLVGDEDALEAEVVGQGGLGEATPEVTEAEAGVDEDGLLAAMDERGVAFAAAAEDSDAEMLGGREHGWEICVGMESGLRGAGGRR